jgi:hypothetical protein
MRQTIPRANRARASSENGPAGCPSISWHASRSRSRRLSSSDCVCAPAGPMPSVNGLHQSSKRRHSLAIPEACGDDATPPGHPSHLAHPGVGVKHEADHETGECRVERVVGKRQLLGGPLSHVAPGLRARHASTNGGEGSIAATASAPARETSSRVRPPGPQPTWSRRMFAPHSRNVCECGRQCGQVAAHQSVIAVGWDDECITGVGAGLSHVEPPVCAVRAGCPSAQWWQRAICGHSPAKTPCTALAAGQVL